MSGDETVDAGADEFDGRIGSTMRAALQTLARRGAYPSRFPLATTVGPNGSAQYGYQSVNRLRARGLIELDPDHPDATPQGSGAVVLTDKGQAYVDAMGWGTDE